MSAQIRITQSVTSLDVINELSELVKNPDKITEAHKIIRKEIALTEEENKKYEEAKKVIKNYEKIKEELNESNKSLEINKELFNKDVKAFEFYQRDIKFELNKKLEETLNKNKALNELLLINAEKSHDLEKEKEIFLKTKNEIENELEDREIEISKLELSLKNKEEELIKQENALKEKAAKLQSIIG